MLIGLINELVELENSNSKSAENILMQLLQHKEDYSSLCEKLEKVLVEKRHNDINNRKANMIRITKAYGYSLTRSKKDKIGEIELVKGRMYKVVCAVNLSNEGTSYIFDQTDKLVECPNKYLEILSCRKTKVLVPESEITLDGIKNMKYTPEEFNERVL